MRAVPIAELKDHLSAYLRLVQGGQEVVIRDRNKPIAKIVRLPVDDLDEHEKKLVEEGILKLPSKPFDAEAFLAIRKNVRQKPISDKVLQEALDWARGDIDVSFLGHKRRTKAVRSRSKKHPSKQAS